MPFEGGQPIYTLDWPAVIPSAAKLAAQPRWAPDSSSLQYAVTRDGVSNIWQQALTDGPPKQITNFKSGLIFDFDWSRDGKELALARGSQTSDVVMINNIR